MRASAQMSVCVRVCAGKRVRVCVRAYSSVLLGVRARVRGKQKNEHAQHDT